MGNSPSLTQLRISCPKVDDLWYGTSAGLKWSVGEQGSGPRSMNRDLKILGTARQGLGLWGLDLSRRGQDLGIRSQDLGYRDRVLGLRGHNLELQTRIWVLKPFLADLELCLELCLTCTGRIMSRKGPNLDKVLGLWGRCMCGNPDGQTNRQNSQKQGEWQTVGQGQYYKWIVTLILTQLKLHQRDENNGSSEMLRSAVTDR